MIDDATPADWIDLDDEIKRLHDSALRLRAAHIDLKRTLRALRAHRRTPHQIQAVVHRAKRALYRSMLLRQRLRMRRPQ